MEIARLEVSPHNSISRECKKLQKCIMSSMENQPNPRRGRNHNHSLVQGQVAQGQVAQGQAATGDPGPVENSTKDIHCHQTPATDVGKEDTKRHRTAKLWKQCAEGVVRKDIMRKFA